MEMYKAMTTGMPIWLIGVVGERIAIAGHLFGIVA